ncbi:MAG: hypothetical protein L3K19_08265 [Thermoplasmata archaeon]|nr:hypothetical protein [Thermoplasmata archaeon]
MVAWIRLKLPPPEVPMALLGPPPPPEPPLDLLVRNIVTTDPRKMIYAFEEEIEDGVMRLIWDAEDPEVLEAELRAPIYDRRLPRDKVPGFWREVKARIAPLGPLPVLGADPRP